MRKLNSTPPPQGVRVQQHHVVGNSPAEIMQKHLRGPNRMLPAPVNPEATRQPRFEDVTSMSYHEMLNKVSGVRSKFESLPSQLRQRFKNDPRVMLSFIDDPKNRKEAVRLGLVPMSDAEYMEISTQAEKDRLAQATAATVAGVREALRSDPEAQPDFGRKAPRKAQEPPQEGGQGGH